MGLAGPRRWQVAVLALVVGLVGGWLVADRSDASHPGRDSADVGFLFDMTTHHQQAVTMSFAYLERGDDPLLAHMAREIAQYQSAEIGWMGGILERWDQTDPPPTMAWMGSGHAGMTMPGFASKSEMEALARASGRDVDDRFTRLMILHHAGGVTMAEAAVSAVDDDTVARRARAMATGQRSEISELNTQRRRLGLPVVTPSL